MRHHRSRSLGIALCAFFFVLVTACSGSSSGLFTDQDGGASSDASSSSTGPALLPSGSPDNPLATGTMVFKLDGEAYSIPGFVSMNGSGNMKVVFGNTTVEGELDIGNGTYEGPGAHSFSAQLRDGSFEFTTSTAKYDVGDSKGSTQTTCTATVTSAPATNFPAKGSEIHGTLTCSKVLRFTKKDNGKFNSDPAGTVDLTDGAFAMLVR